MAKRTNTKFGARLHELREEAGLSMMQLAKAIGVSDAAVCKWENGAAEPKVGYIIKLAEYFDCTTDYLTGNDGYYSAAKPRISITDADGRRLTPTTNRKVHMPAEVLLPDEQMIIGTFRNLSPEHKALIKQTLDALDSAESDGTVKKSTDNG